MRSLSLLAGGPTAALLNVVAFSSQARRAGSGQGGGRVGGPPAAGGEQGPLCRPAAEAGAQGRALRWDA